MKRKTIQLNPSTLCVSLPSIWVKQQNIKKGDELNLTINANELNISTSDKSSFESVTIDCTNEKIFNKNIISSLYQAGFDEIKVLYSSDEILSQIKQRVQDECIGFDILDHDSKSCTIKTISTEFTIDFNEIFKKNMDIMIEMSQKLVEGFEKKEISYYKNIRSLEKLENKLQTFCLRYVSKHGNPLNPKRTSAMYNFIREIENICDCFKRIADEMLDKKIKISKSTVTYSKKVNEMTIALYKLFYQKDKNSRAYINKEGKIIYEQGYNLLRNPSNEGVILYNLVESITRIYYLTVIIDELFS
jgi:phosphate uptake regulator